MIAVIFHQSTKKKEKEATFGKHQYLKTWQWLRNDLLESNRPKNGRGNAQKYAHLVNTCTPCENMRDNQKWQSFNFPDGNTTITQGTRSGFSGIRK